MRAMTYNIHHGEGLDGRIDVERLADVIVHEAADVVFLQEVDRNVPRSGHRDLGWEIARLTHMHVIFGKNADVEGGDYGTAILSTRPLEAHQNVHLPMSLGGEQRGVLHAEIVVEGTRILLVNVHADNRRDDTQRLFHVSRLIELARTFDSGPVILAGDFNDTPQSRTYTAIAQVLDDVWMLAGHGDGFTFSTRHPRKRIDFLWIRGSGALIPRRAWVPRTDASDHLPVMAEFTVIGPGQRGASERMR